MQAHTHRGFTFIEVLMVVGLAGIIALFGVAMSYSSVARSSVLQERDLFVSLLLTGARAQALANINETSHGIRIDNDAHQYVLFDGDDFDTATNKRTTPYTNETIRIKNDDDDDMFDILFEQRSGNIIEGTGTITIANSNNTAPQEITLNDAGQINW